MTAPRYAHLSGACVVDRRPRETSLANHNLLAGDALHRDALRMIDARHLGQATPIGA